MKRTINDIYDLINQKLDNAQKSQTRHMSLYNELSKKENSEKQLKACRDDLMELNGEIEAYLDITILFETSDVLSPKTGSKQDDLTYGDKYVITRVLKEITAQLEKEIKYKEKNNETYDLAELKDYYFKVNRLYLKFTQSK